MGKRIVASLILPPAAFGVLAVFVCLQWFAPVETAVYRWISGFSGDGMTVFMRVITELGGAVPVIVFCLALLLCKRTRLSVGLPISAAALISVLCNQILKNLFQRPRPLVPRFSPADGFSFPSGHSMNNAAFYCMLFLLLLPLVARLWQKALLAVGCILPPLLIGISRIYLGVHFFGDVLGGWLLGIWIACVTYALWTRLCLPAIHRRWRAGDRENKKRRK